MKRIDRYLLRQFFVVALFSLVAFSLLFILIDMVENLDDFIDENVPNDIIAMYYVYFVPRIFGLMVPLAVLLACLFVVGKLSNNNEWTVMKSSGLSLYRLMVPFLSLGLIVSIAMVGFDGWLVPKINAGRLKLEREYLKKHLQSGGRYNMYFQDVNNRIVSFEYYDESNTSARRVTIQQFDEEQPTRLVNRMDAAYMQWNEKENGWRLFNGMLRSIHSDSSMKGGSSETVARFDSLDAGALVLTPTVILRMQQKPEEMELGDFSDYIERQRIAGSDIARLLVDYHGKVAFPFASFIVIIFGVPFASVKRRSGLSVQFGVSILICFTYLVSLKLSQVFGYTGNLPPLIAAWLPNILFLCAGFGVMMRVQK